jgi:hypothetical protein
MIVQRWIPGELNMSFMALPQVGKAGKDIRVRRIGIRDEERPRWHREERKDKNTPARPGNPFFFINGMQRISQGNI